MLRRPLPPLLAAVALIPGGVATGCGSSSGSSSSGLTAMVGFTKVDGDIARSRFALALNY